MFPEIIEINAFRSHGIQSFGEGKGVHHAVAD
jgi:hypothetical protein